MGADNAADDHLFPYLVLAMTVHRPGMEPGNNAMRTLRSLDERGHDKAFCVTDRAYAPGSEPEDYQIPATELGYRLVFDYQKDQLGSQDPTTNGMMQVEGAWYCPSMPQNLIDATKHYWFGDPNNLDEVTKKPIKLTEDEYRQRIDDRRPYLVRLKDGSGTDDRWHCPSSGNKPLAMCERKPDSLVNTQGKRRIFPVVIENNEAPALCQQGSVSLAKHTGAKFQQDLHYGSDEWHGVYSTLRNTIEGENGLGERT